MMNSFAGLYDRFFSAAVVQVANEGLIISSAFGRYAAWAVAFLVLLPLSRWCWKRHIGGRWAPSVFFALFTIPLLIIPSIATESIQVTANAIQVRTGFWFSPTLRNIPLTGVKYISEVQRPARQRRANRMDTFWLFQYENEQRWLNLSDLFEANRHHIKRYLSEHKVQFGRPETEVER